jgi:hypothetical protein
MARIAIGLVTALCLGCGVGLEDSGTDASRDLKNGKLREEYSAVKGTYEGAIQVTGVDKTFPVKFYLFPGEVQEAPLPGDLKPGIRVVLRGRLMQSEFVGDSDNLILTGQYDSVSGHLTLDPDFDMSKTSTGCRLGGQDPITVSADISGEGIQGSVLRNGQEWARFVNMHRTSRDVSSGSMVSEEEEYRRLQNIYAPVTGMYRGHLTRNVCGGQAREEGFDLWMYIERTQEGTGLNGAPCYVPRLMARTLREFSGELADVTYRSIARFDPQSFLPQFTSLQTDRYKLNLSFDPDGAKLSGQIFSTGRWGDVEVTRYQTQVTAPDDETVLLRERLSRTYALFAGDYNGTLMPYDKTVKPWPVNLNVYQDEALVDGTRVPVLMGRYRRMNLSDPSIGSRLMNVSVSIDGCKPLLTMKSDPDPSNPGRIPGVGLMHFTAEFTALPGQGHGQLRGELVDHRGPQGDLTVKK